ncbi:hypothetical protein [Streptomyces flaveolus]|uniref:hypothetical protein n=1 Tax=Streptomyces flaveolus TaxID=67297 RepID=UPI0036FD74CB
MSWSWEYAFGAEEAARNAPRAFLAEADPGGMFTYQVVVRSECVYVVQIICLDA